MMQKKDLSRKPLKLLLVSLISLGFIYIFTFSFSKEDTEKEHKSYVKENYKVFSFSPPENLEFAGNPVPMSEPEVYERMDRELNANTFFHSNTILYFKRANRWFPVIEPILAKNNIPDDFKYLALIESGLQNVVSPAGATGYWQFLKETAKEYGLTIDNEVDERYHVEKSTEAACRYLNEAYDKYKDWALVAASYNMGMNALSSELERQKASNYYDLLLNQETKRYVFRIIAVKEIMNNPEDYGFNIRKVDLYEPLDYKTISLDSTVNDFAVYAQEYDISYKILKYFNPWLRQSYLKNTSNKSFEIKIPLTAEYKSE